MYVYSTHLVAGGLYLNSKNVPDRRDSERLQFLGRKRKGEWDATPSRDGYGGNTPRLDGSSSIRSRSGEWDNATPRAPSSSYADSYDRPQGDLDFAEWDEEQKRLDRDWYNSEESGAVDETHNEFTDVDGYYKRKEEQLAQQQKVHFLYQNRSYGRKK